MKKRNLCKIPLIFAVLGLAFAMAFTSCDKDGGGDNIIDITVEKTEGKLVISGLDTYPSLMPLGAIDGYKVVAFGGDQNDTTDFIAADSVSIQMVNLDIKMDIRGATITEGKATLNLWQKDDAPELRAFSGNIKPNGFMLGILKKNINMNEEDVAEFEKFMETFDPHNPPSPDKLPKSFVATVLVPVTAISNKEVSIDFSKLQSP